MPGPVGPSPLMERSDRVLVLGKASTRQSIEMIAVVMHAVTEEFQEGDSELGRFQKLKKDAPEVPVISCAPVCQATVL